MGDLPSGTVTFLFTDIEGSTKLAQSLADKWEALRARHHEILKSTIEANNGYVFQIVGDEFCASFHTAGEAICAAAQAQIDLFNEDWGDLPLKVRMGISTGTAEGSTDTDHSGGYKGYTALARVNRLMSAGHGGQVLISLATEELVRDNLPDDITLRDLGKKRLKGLFHPERTYQLVISGLPSEFPPLKTLDDYRNNLPTLLTSFIGREKEMAEVEFALSNHRLVTLTGTGGTGKTRLALQVATNSIDQYTDGVWLVELAAITDPGLIPQTILSAMGIPEQRAMTNQQLLLDHLRGKNMLFVLDNCEHLIEASAKLVDDIVNHAMRIKILITSREALGLQGEMIWFVPSLSLPDINQMASIEQFTQFEAVQLFIERAKLVQPLFKMTNENAPTIAQICSRLDGVPLAIELAAARVRTMSVDQISKRLDDRFRLLTGGNRTALERHQTLRAAVAWSYDLLTDDEKILFRMLSVFASGWRLEAAEQVCAEESDNFDVLDLLTHLVEKSLVNLDGSRYRMLETTHQFAREKLFASEEGPGMFDKHLNYYLELVERADKEIHGPDQVAWADRLEKELPNIRIALDWCVSEQRTESALLLLDALTWAWFLRDHIQEFRTWFSRILTLPKVTDYPMLYARLLGNQGLFCWLTGDLHEAHSVLNESREIWLSLGVEGELGLAWTLIILGELADIEGNITMAVSLYERGLDLHRKYDALWGMANALINLGEIATTQDDYEQALSLFEQGLDLFHQMGDVWGIGRASQMKGYLFMKQGKYEKAQQSFEQFIRCREGHNYGTIVGLLPLGYVCRCQKKYDQAEQYYKRGLAMSREIGFAFFFKDFFYALAMLALHRNDYTRASQLFTDYINAEHGSSNNQSACSFLMGMAAVAARTNQPERTGKLYGAVQALLETIDHQALSVEQELDKVELYRLIRIAEEQLGEETFDACVAEGHKHTLEKAIDYALELTSE